MVVRSSVCLAQWHSLGELCSCDLFWNKIVAGEIRWVDVQFLKPFVLKLLQHYNDSLGHQVVLRKLIHSIVFHVEFDMYSNSNDYIILILFPIAAFPLCFFFFLFWWWGCWLGVCDKWTTGRPHPRVITSPSLMLLWRWCQCPDSMQVVFQS